MSSTFENGVDVWRSGLFGAKDASDPANNNQKLFDGAIRLVRKGSLEALTGLYNELYSLENFPIKEIKVSLSQTAYAISFQGYVIRLRVVVHKADDEPYIEDVHSEGRVIRGHRYYLQLNMIHCLNRAPVSLGSIYFLPQGADTPIVEDEFCDEEVCLKLFELFSLFEYLSLMYHSS